MYQKTEQNHSRSKDFHFIYNIMKANLLIVSVDEFPLHISHYLEDHGFRCFYSRGGIKTQETLSKHQIDTIIWLYLGHERALAGDLLKIFNQYKDIPLVFVTQSYDELDFAEDIKGLFANLDLNDDIEDFLGTIETSCNQPDFEETEEESAETEPAEIDFKNVVSRFFRRQTEAGEKKEDLESKPLKKITLWNAVDKTEKKLLSGPSKTKKKR